MASLADLQTALQNAHDAGDTQAATQLADAIVEMSSTRTPIEQAQYQEATSPEYLISPRNIALGGLIGSLIGGGEAALAKGGIKAGNAAFSMLKGGVTGAGTTAVGESVKQSYNNSPTGQMIALGAELASGAVPNLVGDFISRVPSAAVTAGFGYNAGKTAQALTGRSESDIAARNKLFGYESVKEGVTTDNFRTAAQNEQRDLISKYGISLPKDVPVERGIRDVYENTIDNLRGSNTLFSNSPQFMNVRQNLEEAVKNKVINSNQKRIIEGVLASDKSKALNSQEYGSRIDSLIHSPDKIQGLTEATDEGKKLIRKVLGENYDSFFMDKTGKPLFSLMKKAEESNYVAKARDSIPLLINQQFKGKEFESVIDNFRKSPQAQQDLRIAVASYLKNLPEKEALSAFNDLYPTLQKTKAMDAGELAMMKSNVSKFFNKSRIVKTGDIAGTALRASIVRGILPAEAISRTLGGSNPQESSAFSPLTL